MGEARKQNLQNEIKRLKARRDKLDRYDKRQNIRQEDVAEEVQQLEEDILALQEQLDVEKEKLK